MENPTPDSTTLMKISDLTTFNEATTGKKCIAGLYFYATLDHLIDLAYSVAEDFCVRRPQLYTSGDDDIANALLEIHYSKGKNETLLSQSQRQALWSQIFGRHGRIEGMTNNFQTLLSSLFDAAHAYVTRAEIETGEGALRAEFVLRLIPFQQFLVSMQSQAMHVYRNRVMPALTEKYAYKVLRSSMVSSVFGFTAAPDGTWPYAFDHTGRSFLLAEEIANRLEVDTYQNDAQGHSLYSQSSQIFSETLAKNGAVAMSRILDVDPNACARSSVIDIISHCYSWRSAMVSNHDKYLTAPIEETAKRKLLAAASSFNTQL